MFSVCGNPNGRAPFDYRRGRFFSASIKTIHPAKSFPTRIPSSISGCAALAVACICWSTRMGAVFCLGAAKEPRKSKTCRD